MSTISDMLTVEAFARCSDDVDTADLQKFAPNAQVAFQDQQSMGQFLMDISEDGRLLSGLLRSGEGRKICRRGGKCL